jgi:aspartyl-tRNA(Asn)/glutamyl-tRNA(Gln) amidotransferase subunit A
MAATARIADSSDTSGRSNARAGGPRAVTRPAARETIASAGARLRRGDTSSLALIDNALDAIARHGTATNAFVSVDADGARARAQELDAELARGVDRGPLHGVPLSLKDLIDVAGVVTTAGSRVLHDRVASVDAPIVTRLRDAGAIVIGRANLHEFALGTTSEDSAFGAVHNPHDVSRSAGGSSGGSAAAVAMGMGLASIGTDTGGSVRIPATACGVVGLKPAIGDIPTDGVLPLSPTLDHVGPLTNSVQDAAWIWQVLSGRRVSDVRPAAIDRLRLKRLGGYFDRPLEPAVRTAFDAAVRRIELGGARVWTETIDASERIGAAYAEIVLSEGAQWHAHWLDTRGDDYQPQVRARITHGRTYSAVTYLDARAFCTDLRRVVDAALEDCDALVLPTLPIVAPRLGASEVVVDPADGIAIAVRAIMLKHTQPFNLTGHPAISLPIAVDGLPVGLQLVGRAHDTARLLDVAAACEPLVRER